MSSQNLLELSEKTRSLVDTIISKLNEHNISADGIDKNGYPTGFEFNELNAARYDLLQVANDLQHATLCDKEWLKVTFAVVCISHQKFPLSLEKQNTYVFENRANMINWHITSWIISSYTPSSPLHQARISTIQKSAKRPVFPSTSSNVSCVNSC
jgi:hypothetical protein